MAGRGAFHTVNNVRACGDAIDGPGPVIAGGMLFANSGYAYWGGAPGNVLLALRPGIASDRTPDGRGPWVHFPFVWWRSDKC